MRIAFLFLLAFSLIIPGPAARADNIDNTAEKARLQAAMQQFIDRQSVDNALLFLDMKTGTTKRYYPVKAHPMIMQMGGHFVLCADLKDERGQSVPVDFYLAPDGRRFVVYHTEIDNRAPLKTLMKRGIVKKLP